MPSARMYRSARDDTEWAGFRIVATARRKTVPGNTAETWSLDLIPTL